MSLNPLFIRSQIQIKQTLLHHTHIKSSLNPLFIRSQFQITGMTSHSDNDTSSQSLIHQVSDSDTEVIRVSVAQFESQSLIHQVSDSDLYRFQL